MNIGIDAYVPSQESIQMEAAERFGGMNVGTAFFPEGRNDIYAVTFWFEEKASGPLGILYVCRRDQSGRFQPFEVPIGLLKCPPCDFRIVRVDLDEGEFRIEVEAPTLRSCGSDGPERYIFVVYLEDLG